MRPEFNPDLSSSDALLFPRTGRTYTAIVSTISVIANLTVKTEILIFRIGPGYQRLAIQLASLLEPNDHYEAYPKEINFRVLFDCLQAHKTTDLNRP